MLITSKFQFLLRMAPQRLEMLNLYCMLWAQKHPHFWFQMCDWRFSCSLHEILWLCWWSGILHLHRKMSAFIHKHTSNGLHVHKYHGSLWTYDKQEKSSFAPKHHGYLKTHDTLEGSFIHNHHGSQRPTMSPCRQSSFLHSVNTMGPFSAKFQAICGKAQRYTSPSLFGVHSNLRSKTVLIQVWLNKDLSWFWRTECWLTASKVGKKTKKTPATTQKKTQKKLPYVKQFSVQWPTSFFTGFQQGNSIWERERDSKRERERNHYILTQVCVLQPKYLELWWSREYNSRVYAHNATALTYLAKTM